MTMKKVLLQVAFCFCIFDKGAASDEHSTREKRANSSKVPVLSMTINHVNVSDYLRHGDHYLYTTTLKHSHPESEADAKGIHVIWMLASFTKFRNVVSFTGPTPPKVVQRDDSVTFKLDELVWGAVFKFSFKVEFDPERSLKPASYSIVTPVQLLYYDQYSENADGVVLRKGQYFSHPLDRVAFSIELPGCSAPLGMKSKKIHDYQITASSSYSQSRPSRARETDDAWCAKDQDERQYIQVDFLLKTRVTRVGILRRRVKGHFVKEYRLQYSDDDITWTDYLENGHLKIFKGPQTVDDKEMIVHSLRHPIEANNFRLRPVTYYKQICLRMELYGCEIVSSPTNCIYALGLESGEIKDDALSHSIPLDQNDLRIKPRFIRLNEVVIDFPFGWSRRPAVTGHVQIDFGSLKKVTRVATVGGYTSGLSALFYVSSFKLEYSNNSLTWEKYRENEKVKDVKGPQDSREAKFPVFAKLAEPFVARYVRIIPNDLGSMRAELYGCSAEELPPYKDARKYARRSFLLDPVNDRFFVCMYSAEETESSCFSTVNGVEWNSIKPIIISVTACNPAQKELYGLDRRMNMFRSRDAGDTWQQITDGYINKIEKEKGLVRATVLPENLVSDVPTANLTAFANSTGVTWGVSGSGIHVMAAGSNYWSMVGLWKCCG